MRVLFFVFFKKNIHKPVAIFHCDSFQYFFNLLLYPNTLQGHLSDNKWHTVIIGRPSRYKHTLMVDGHIATATTRGDNYLLDLDGILYLGKLFMSPSMCVPYSSGSTEITQIKREGQNS